MAKRVTLKGRGADIFFGDYAGAPEHPTAEPAAPAAGADPATLPVAMSAGAERPARVQASKQASKQAVRQARNGTPQRGQLPVTEAPPAPDPERAPLDAALLPTAAILEAVWDELVAPATITNSFRYTEPELEALNDAIYALTRRHRARLSKQEVARLGLNLVLWDYRVHGEASLLEELARRRSRKRREED